MGARTLEKCKTYYEGRVFKTRFASHQVRCLTDDVSMMREMDGITNQRSFDVCNGIELV